MPPACYPWAGDGVLWRIFDQRPDCMDEPCWSSSLCRFETTEATMKQSMRESLQQEASSNPRREEKKPRAALNPWK
ncbi:unnamed protein product [Blepharisma stoltei]|uniref:Uncharacterized protein n=1 Tax=Blepharisma stoltei TaxID=1481888 RepID=A0AAU9IX10_9CILI|nr:unnamed protein product [Blepharisma stoltei]